MLRALAARRVGDVPSNVTAHYVSQEVHLSEAYVPPKILATPITWLFLGRFLHFLDG